MNPVFQIENFETVCMLGRGGMATVWKARQSSLDRFVAIKVLSSAFATDPADIARFREEARAAGRLKHSGIVQVYDANFNNGCYYIVMELVDGYTVGEWIRRKRQLSEVDALTVAESVITALDYAWTSFGIIHCDIKPENVMVDADGTVKTTDLGLARAIVSMQSKEQEQEVLGTPAYMSPEQVSGQPDLDCRADIYALGATLYHMVTGHPLFAGGGDDDDIMQKQLVATVPSPSREVEGLSHGFVLLMAKMLAKDRKYRPQDWKAVLADIRRVREHRSPAGHEPPPGSSTIFIDADESDTVRRHAMQAAAEARRQPDRNDRGLWVARLSLWILILLLLLTIGFALWWFLLGGSGIRRGPAHEPLSAESCYKTALAYVTENPNDVKGGFDRLNTMLAQAPALCDAQEAQKQRDRLRDDCYKVALAHVNDNPNDLKGGIDRLNALLAQAPGSWYAQEAQNQRDRLTKQLENAVYAFRSDLDAKTRVLVARNHADEALKLLEKYQGEYAAETLAWRQEQAQMLRGQPATGTPAPSLATAAPPVPPPDQGAKQQPPPARQHPPVMTEEGAVWWMAHAVLKNGSLDIVTRRAADMAVNNSNWSEDGKFGAMRKLLEQARATEHAVIDTFASENGREIQIGLRVEGLKKVTVGDVTEDRDHVHLILPNGGDHVITLDDLDFGERLKRLKRSGESADGATLLKAFWAYRAHALDKAKEHFASLPDPAGTIFARAVDDKP